jgi:hypothetical protein
LGDNPRTDLIANVFACLLHAILFALI